MFRKLVESLFSPFKSNNKPNYLYFEESKSDKDDEKTEAISALQTTLTKPKPVYFISKEDKYQTEFYDFLFGQPSQLAQHDDISEYVASQVEKLLENPRNILNSLPVLPVSLTKILDQLNDKDFECDVLIELIQQDAVIAGKVTELANSSFYNRSDKEVTDLKTAFMLLGANGLMEGVINGFVSKLAPQVDIYFKQYGDKIWQHSLATGCIAKHLISASRYKKESAQGYLIGLISNLGNMVIYQLLVESFSFVHPDCQPNSIAFKNILLKNAKKITFYIAKHWNFPSSILTALALQVKLTKSTMLEEAFKRHPIGAYIYEANIISELEMRFESKDIDECYLREAIDFLLFSKEAKQYLEVLLKEDVS